MKTILVTGGAGFIGSHFVDLLINKTDYKIIVIDNLTYAGKRENMESFINSKRVEFFKLDISNFAAVMDLFNRFSIQIVINFAAESHVDNSINNSEPFIESNIKGTYNLLEASRKSWTNSNHSDSKFVQISTDEVYGSVEENKSFTETSVLNPRNPYSASKAAAEHLVMSYHFTYNLNTIITRSSNNYGPRQDNEKLIPKIITRYFRNKSVPIYGTGNNIRDWIYVLDNCNAILRLMEKGLFGQIYNIRGNNEISNLDLLGKISKLISTKPNTLYELVKDRAGHDFRYSLDDRKAIALIGPYSTTDFEIGLKQTIEFYKTV